ncbi:MAG: response regulator [Victivallales bacterium]|nr:response regulator [Victivallales bacterium]MCF7889325.1 response regulator [Victivallales bacterium]
MKNIPLAKNNETILVVDDEDSIWDFVIEALQNLGYTVILAGNGQEAVEIFETNPGEINLVFLDMVMPKLGGHSTFYKLRKIKPDIKILLSSGYVSEEEIEDLMEQGASGFIPKPHKVRELAVEIRRILDSA